MSHEKVTKSKKRKEKDTSASVLNSINDVECLKSHTWGMDFEHQVHWVLAYS